MMKAAYNRSRWADWTRKNNGDFYSYINPLVENYVRQLERNDLQVKSNDVTAILNERIKCHLDISKSVAHGVTEAVRYYLVGKPNKAYESLASSLRPSSGMIKSWGQRCVQKDMLSLFRLRVSESKRDVESRNDIFHVPFEKRHNIGSYRYSIHGLPCLYLGTSLYTCWEEMNRPDFDKTFFSRFKVCVPDMAIFSVGDKTPNVMCEKFEAISEDWESASEANGRRERYKEQIEDIADGLIMWPLTLACSIPTIFENAIFHPEYIVPQLLMQYIAESEEFDAIVYRTTKVPADGNASRRLLLNFAFPTKSSKPFGFCDTLQSFFEFTEPVSWELAVGLYPAVGFSAKPISDAEKKERENLLTKMKMCECALSNCEFSPTKNTTSGYGDSDFGKLEKYSATYPVARLSRE